MALSTNKRYLWAGAKKKKRKEKKKEKTQNVTDDQPFKMIMNIVQHLIASLISK